MKNYEDIINRPHHVSRNHSQMTMRDRAAQFSPFAALTGYDDAIDETGRLTAERHELSELEQAELNKRLAILIGRQKEKPDVVIEYFVPDEHKSGGSYQTIVGKLKHISLPERIIVLSNGESIHLDDIMSINCENKAIP